MNATRPGMQNSVKICISKQGKYLRQAGLDFIGTKFLEFANHQKK